MERVSRRSFLMGAALVGCSSGPAGLPAFSVAGGAKDHWTTRLLGRPPVGMLATRFVVPRARELRPLFRRWEPSALPVDPPPSLLPQPVRFAHSAFAQSPDAEIFADEDGTTITVLRGVPPDVDPFLPRCFQRGEDPCGLRSTDYKLVGCDTTRASRGSEVG